jgi:hypothetical protein
MKSSAIRITAFLVAVTAGISAADINVSGIVKSDVTTPVTGALVSILGPGVSVLTDAQGKFRLTAISSVKYPLLQTVAPARPAVTGSYLRFQVASPGNQVRITVFDLLGHAMGAVVDRHCTAGSYRCAPVALLSKRAAPGMYAVQVKIGSQVTMFSVMNATGIANAGLVQTAWRGTNSALGKAAASVDTLEVAAQGFKIFHQGLATYTDSGLVIVLTAATISPNGQHLVDSLFDLLIKRIKSLDSLDSAKAAKYVDFTSLRNAFDGYLKTQDAYNMKANVGYEISTVFSLNTSDSVWKMVDSLDAYFKAIDSSNNPGMAKTMRKEGVTGLGKMLAAKTPQILMVAAKEPSFPLFIKLSFIQNIVENEVVPALDDAIRASQRIETAQSMLSMTHVVDNDTFTIDRNDVFVFDAGLHLLRAYMNMFCMYNMDIYYPGATNYSWIDTARSISSSSHTIYSLTNDTIVQKSVTNPDPAMFAGRVMHYNLTQSSFMTLRRTSQSMVKNDLLAIPSLVKTAITAIRAETGDQAYDIIKLSDVSNMDSGLVDVPKNMMDNGISSALANEFRSPETIAQFVTDLLSGPYTFNEKALRDTGGRVTDTQTIKITVNLTSWLDNPVNDLRTLLPKYQWKPESSWVSWTLDTAWVQSGYNTRSIYANVKDSLAIAAAQYDSIAVSSGNSRICYLKNPAHCWMSADSSYQFMPIDLLDDNNKAISLSAVDSLIKAKSFFPYFTDYTLHGLFPGMTRANWINLVYGSNMQ